LGVSDRPYFAWLRDALARYEGETGELSALARETGGAELWVLAGARANPAIDSLVETCGRERTRVRFLDKFARGQGVTAADLNALEALPENACDVVLLTRASYLVERPRAFLAGARRLLRPGGLMIVDWIHGAADAPRLDLFGHLDYDGRAHPFVTTYCDARALSTCARQFDALLAHVNRPPASVDVARPGARVPWGERARRMLGGGPRRDVTRASYLETLAAELGRAGKHLIDAGLMEEYFKVVHRDARYFHPSTGKFYLYLLTVLRPVGK
jgi:SAM-dependent methyltransferase